MPDLRSGTATDPPKSKPRESVTDLPGSSTSAKPNNPRPVAPVPTNMPTISIDCDTLNQSSLSTSSHPNLTHDVRATPELDILISNIVHREFERQGHDLVHNVLHPNSNNSWSEDQGINPEYNGNLSDMDKIPDVVRCLREFSGAPGEFSSWRKSVDRILKIYEPLRGSPKYYGILNVIRNKIVGNADIALESYNTVLDWKAISKCLTMHYGDKRDLGTLEYQMNSLVQGNQSVQEFYQMVYQHLSLILNKISCMDVGPESLNLLTRTYRDKALDTFIRGLKGDLPRLLGIREPVDLPQALYLCLKLQNQNYRAGHAYGNHNTAKKSYNSTPQNPHKNWINNSTNPQGNPQSRQRFHFQPNFIPSNQPQERPPFQYQNNQQNAPRYQPQHNFRQPFIPGQQTQAPQQYFKPEPVSQNSRVRSHQFSRPQHLAIKQPQPSTSRPQANYHIHSEYDQAQQAEDSNYNQTMAEFVQPLEEYEDYTNPDQNEIVDFSDIHFLG